MRKIAKFMFGVLCLFISALNFQSFEQWVSFVFMMLGFYIFVNWGQANKGRGS